MRILVTGAAGRLGREIIRVFAVEHEVFPFDAEGCTLPRFRIEPLDIVDRSAVEACVSGVGADLVIHAAAHTDVDGCEADPDAAFRVNAIGTWNVAAACAEENVPVVYVSTDFVFDGEKGEPYTEFDQPNPISAYGRSKYAGERIVRNLCRRHFVVRTAWLYSVTGKSFPAAILETAMAGKPLKVVTDQVGSPTYDPDLAYGIYRLVIGPKRELSNMFGTYHVVNQGYCSRWEMAKKAVELAGLDAEVEPITTDQLEPTGRPVAPRPRNSALRCYCAELMGMSALRPWEDALSEFVSKWTTARH